jgi:putative tryptophan/tyrosine transport system substrate-binding protein
MRRREFVRLLGGAAAAPSLFWPLAARAQRLPLLGYLHSASPQPFTEETSAFRQGLSEAGYVDGQNLVIEYRWADGDTDRLPAMAQELVRRHAAVIAAIGGDVTALAAKAATATIPIVFLNGSDPVHSGLVAGINRPGGNVTGVSLFGGTLDGKRLELLRELVPQVALVAVLMNPLVAETGARSRALEEAAHTLGLRLLFLEVNSEREFDAAFATIARERAGALFVSGSPFFLDKRAQLIALAAQHGVPAVYAWRQLAAAGGLVSYGTSIREASRQAGIYAGRILKGERPAELPVLQPTKFELVINLKTAKALALTVPATLLAIADEVIE